MVMRSVAGAGFSTHLAGGPFESSSERIPIGARVDSDIPRLEANSAKRRFSSAVGRTLIEGPRPAPTSSFAMFACAALIGVFDLKGEGE
jgi:hypothetical protein